MPIKTGGGLETVTLVLAEGQVARLRQMTEERRSPINRVSLSDVAREIVEAGLATLPTDDPQSADISKREAAVA